MVKIALSLPGYDQITNTPMDTKVFNDPVTGFPTIGRVVTVFSDTALFAGAFLMFFWAAWGVFDYIRAEGNKDALAKARKRIQWAIAGFVILVLAFFLSDFTQKALAPKSVPLTPVNIPGITNTP